MGTWNEDSIEKGNKWFGWVLGIVFFVCYAIAGTMDYQDAVEYECRTVSADYGRESATVCEKVKEK